MLELIKNRTSVVIPKECRKAKIKAVKISGGINSRHENFLFILYILSEKHYFKPNLLLIVIKKVNN